MQFNGREYVFSSGRIRYANCGIIGLAEDMVVTEGYDGGFFNAEFEYENEYDPLTQADLLELADYMLNLWAKFRQTHSQPIEPKQQT